MTPRASALTAVFLLGISDPAMAHDAVEGAGPFVNGVLHPLAVPAHLMILSAVSFWMGGQPRPAALRSLAIIAIALGLGLAIAPFAAPLSPTLLSALAFVVGALAASAWVPPTPIFLGAVAAVGGLIGLDSANQDPLALAGVWIGANLIVFNLANLALRFKTDWVRIALRIGGAWIAAIALLILALGLKG